jgi:hypothetical protein
MPQGDSVSVASDLVGDSPSIKPGRLVALRRDKEDFVVAFQPEETVHDL